MEKRVRQRTSDGMQTHFPHEDPWLRNIKKAGQLEITNSSASILGFGTFPISRMFVVVVYLFHNQIMLNEKVEEKNFVR